MTDVATLRRLHRQMIYLAADAYSEGNERLAAKALEAAELVAASMERAIAREGK